MTTEINNKTNEYTELERLAKAYIAELDAERSGKKTKGDPAMWAYMKFCGPELILKLVQKSRVQTQLVEALEAAEQILCRSKNFSTNASGKFRNISTVSTLAEVKAALAAAKETM